MSQMAQHPKPGRLACIVPFCRRTAASDRYPPGTVIICGKCFRMASRTLRHRIRRIERFLKRAGIERFEQTRPATKERKAVILHTHIFDRIVRQATDAKVGIG